MSDLSRHIKEIGETLAPEYGPESSSDAVDRLLEYYLKLDWDGRTAFVAALIGELVTLKTMYRTAQRARERVLREGAA